MGLRIGRILFKRRSQTQDESDAHTQTEEMDSSVHDAPVCQASSAADSIRDTAASYNAKALEFQHLEQYEMAYQYHELAIIARSPCRDTMVLEIASSYMNMGLCYQRLSRFTEAKALFSKGMKTLLQRCGEFHPATIACLTSIGECFEGENKLEKAIKCYSRAEDALRLSQNDSSPELVLVYVKLHNCYKKKNDTIQALKYKHKVKVACTHQCPKRSDGKLMAPARYVGQSAEAA